MSHYETSTIVGGQGEIHLAGLPFMPGTEVEVVVNPKPPAPTAACDERTIHLLAALDRARNIEPIGALRREVG